MTWISTADNHVIFCRSQIDPHHALTKNASPLVMILPQIKCAHGQSQPSFSIQISAVNWSPFFLTMRARYRCHNAPPTAASREISISARLPKGHASRQSQQTIRRRPPRPATGTTSKPAVNTCTQSPPKRRDSIRDGICAKDSTQSCNVKIQRKPPFHWPKTHPFNQMAANNSPQLPMVRQRQ